MRYFRYTLILLIFTGCSSREFETEHSFQVYEQDGVTIVETTGGPKYEGELFQYEEVFTLNQDATNTDGLLYRPRYFYMDKDGFIYVEDNGNSRIAVFDTDGYYHHSIGRSGAGPGEFRYASIVSITDSTLSVYDTAQKRLSTFWKDGRLIRTVRSPIGRSSWLDEMHEGTDKSSVLISRSTGIIRGVPSSEDNVYRREVLIFSSTGDTIASIQSPSVTVAIQQAGQRYLMSFSGRPSVSFRPATGIIVCGGKEPFLEIYRSNGVLYKKIRIECEPDPLLQPIRADMKADFEYLSDNAETQAVRNTAERILNNLRDIIPETMDFSVAMWIDNSNYVWLMKPGYGGDIRAQRTNGEIPVNMPTFRVLSPEGEYLGDTTAPYLFGRVCYGHFLTTTENPITGEQKFIVYRIESVVEGFDYP